MDKVRFGIVGCGNMGVGHTKNFLDEKIVNGCISAVCDINSEKFAFFKEKFGDSIKYFIPLKKCSSPGSATLL